MNPPQLPEKFGFSNLPPAAYTTDQFGQTVLTESAKAVIAYCCLCGQKAIPSDLSLDGAIYIAAKFLAFSKATGGMLSMSGGRGQAILPGPDDVAKMTGAIISTQANSQSSLREWLGEALLDRCEELIRKNHEQQTKEKTQAKD